MSMIFCKFAIRFPNQKKLQMPKSKKKIDIFKPYLQVGLEYKGGKSISAVAAEAGVDKVYKLSSNENVLGSSPKAIKAIEKHLSSLNIYPDNTDHRLRAALAKFYNNELTADQFITTPSGSEILEIIIRAFLGEGTECIISNPCFMPYKMFSQKQGAKVIDIRLKDPDYKLDIDGIIKAINSKTRLIFLTSPNNPTGTYIPKKDMDKLMRHVPEHVIVVLDEVYFQFADAKDFVRPLHYVKKGKNVIGLNSFSKAYGLAGLRLGYAYFPTKLAKYVRQLIKPFFVNTLALEAGMAALTDKAFLKKTVNLILREKKYLYKELDKTGIHYWKTQGNFILLKPKMKIADFENAMLMQGVMVRPVAGFGAPGCARVTIGTREANKAFISALKILI